MGATAGSRAWVRQRAGAGLRALMLAAVSSSAVGAEWSGLVGWGSDSLLHGRSLTDGRPGWFGDLRVDNGRWTLGLGAVTEHPPLQSRGAQLTLDLDRRWRFGEDWLLRAGLVHYESPWNLWNDELRYDEASIGLGWRGRWSLLASHAPDLPVVEAPGRYRRARATWVESGWHQPLGSGFALHVGLGHADIRGVHYARQPQIELRDYAYASAGLGFAYGDIHLHALVVHASRRGADYFGNGAPRTRLAVSASWAF